jgi:hypothetical protein
MYLGVVIVVPFAKTQVIFDAPWSNDNLLLTLDCPLLLASKAVS